MKRFLFTLLIFLLCIKIIKGQNPNSPPYPPPAPYDFETEVQKREAYYNQLEAQYGTKKGTGYSDFRRWENFWRPRLSGRPDFKIPNEIMADYVQALDGLIPGGAVAKTSSSTYCAPTPEWQSLGPFKQPDLKGCVPGSQKKGIGVGRVDVFKYHPNYDSPGSQGFHTVFAGSPSGGLWKSTDDGATWQNMGFDNMPQIGVHDLAIDYQNPNIMYIATAFQEFSALKWEPSSASMGIWKSTDGGQSWGTLPVLRLGYFNTFNDPLFDLQRWANVSKILIHPTDPNIVFATVTYAENVTDAATPRGWLYRSNDRGDTWSIVDDPVIRGELMFDLEFHPENPSIMYLSGHKVFRSNGGGNVGSWTHLTGISIETDNKMVCPNYPYSWVYTDHEMLFIETSRAKPDNLYVYWKGVKFTSYTNCSTFTTIANRKNILISNNRGDTFPLAYNYNNSTTPGIDDFDGQNIRDPDCFAVTDYVDPSTQNPLIYVGLNTVWLSKDHGLTLKIVPANTGYYTTPYHVDIHTIALAPTNSPGPPLKKLFVGSDGGVYKSTNEGVTGSWTICNEGLAITQFHRIAVSASDGRFMGGAQDANVNYRDANGKWFFANYSDNFECLIDPVNPQIMFTTTQSSLDGTINEWGNYTNGLQTPLGIDDIRYTPLEFEKSNDLRLLAGTYQVHSMARGANRTTMGNWVQRSNFPGDTTYKYTPIINANGDTIKIKIDTLVKYFRITAMHQASGNRNIMWVANDKRKIYKCTNLLSALSTADGIANFTEVPYPINFDPDNNKHFISDFVTDPNDNNRVWMTLSGYDFLTAGNNVPVIDPETGFRQGARRVAYSANGGQTWTDLFFGLPAFPVNVIVMDPTDKTLYIGTDAGVYHRKEGGVKWECYNHNLPRGIVRDLEIDVNEGKLVAGTFGRGLWSCDLLSNCERLTSTATIPQVRLTTVLNQLNNKDTPVFTHLVVKQGDVVTLGGGTILRMAGDRKIIVEDGGTLIINDAKLTSFCPNKRWRGIEVWGNYLSGPLTQGRLTLGNTTIENAEFGVYVGRPKGPNFPFGGLPDDPFIAHSGGRLTIDGAHFINNRNGVFFAPYNKEQTLTLQNAEFICNAALVGETNPKQGSDIQLRIYGRSGIKVENCTFKNTLVPNDAKDYGLSAEDVGNLTVNNSLFDGVKYGINLAAYAQTPLFTSGVQEILNNTFLGSQTVVNQSVYSQIGINLFGSQYNTTIRNNLFNPLATSLNKSGEIVYGITISGVGAVRLFENTTKNCSIGIKYGNEKGDSFNGNLKAYKNKADNVFHGWAFNGQNIFSLFDCNTFDNYEIYALMNLSTSVLSFDDGEVVTPNTIGVTTSPVTNYFKGFGEEFWDIYNYSLTPLNYVYTEPKPNKCPQADIVPDVDPGTTNVTLQSTGVNCPNCNGGIPNGKAIGWLKNKLANTLNPSQRRRLIRQILDAYAENNDAQGAASWINTQNPSEAGLLLFPYYIANNQFSLAQALVSALPAADSSDITTKIYYQLLLTMAQNGVTIPETDSITVAIVNNLAHSLYPIRHNARGFMYIYNKSLIFDPLPQQTFFQRLANPNALDVTPENESVKIYPNPTTGNLTLSVSQGFVNNAIFEITDVFGRPRINGTIGAPEQTFDLSDLPAGIYTASVKIGKSIVYVQKVIKK